MGACTYIYDVCKIFGTFDPSPLVCNLDQFIVLNSRNLPYYISPMYIGHSCNVIHGHVYNLFLKEKRYFLVVISMRLMGVAALEPLSLSRIRNHFLTLAFLALFFKHSLADFQRPEGGGPTQASVKGTLRASPRSLEDNSSQNDSMTFDLNLHSHLPKPTQEYHSEKQSSIAF